MIEAQLNKYDGDIVKISMLKAGGNRYDAEEIAQMARIRIFMYYDAIKNAAGELDIAMVKTQINRASKEYYRSGTTDKRLVLAGDMMPAESDEHEKTSVDVGSTEARLVEDAVELSLYTRQLVDTLKVKCREASLTVLNVLLLDPEQSNSDVGSVIGRKKNAVQKQKARISRIAWEFDASQSDYYRSRCAI